jgi:hypothetical protein
MREATLPLPTGVQCVVFSRLIAEAEAMDATLFDISYSCKLPSPQRNKCSGTFSPPAEMPRSVKKEIDNKLSLFKTENLVAPRLHFTTFCFFYCNLV